MNINGHLDETVIAVTGPFPATEQDALDIHVSDINFDDLMKIVNSADFGGTGEYTAKLTSDGKLNGHIKIPNADFFDIPIGMLTGDLNYHNGQVFIENGRLTKNTIENSGQPISSQPSVSVSHQPSAVSHQPSAVSEEGFGSSETSYSRKPKAESRKPYNRKPLVAEGLREPTADSHLAESRKPIAIRTEYTSQASITGVVDLEGEFPAQLSVIAKPVYVQHYPKLLLGAEYPVTGQIRGELALDGTLINLDGSADFRVTEGIAWGIHLDPLTLPLHIEDYYLTLPDVKITTRGQKITLNVAVAPNADFDFRLESDAPVNFQELSKAAQISDFPFDGQFDVSVIGTLKQPQPLDFQIELDFKDITYLDFEDNGDVKRFPLGAAALHGELVALKNTTGEADRFDFTGNGFSGQIQGYVSMALDNPYKFTVETNGLEVNPILRILHPAFDTVTGVADGRAQITGTVTDLVGTTENTVPNAAERRIYPYEVDIAIDTSLLHYGDTGGPTVPFTNAEQIQIHLRDDIWTIDTLSCRTLEDTSPFIELTGTFDQKNDTMDLHAKANGFALSPLAPAFGLAPEDIPAGTGHYTAEIDGSSEHPIVVSNWGIPKLDLKTKNGDLHITEASGKVDYRNDSVYLGKMALKIFGNAVNIAGDIDVDLEALNNSQLYLTVNAPTLEITTFAELIAKASENAIKSTDLTGGVLGISVDITGTFAETSISINAQTAPNQPIHLMPISRLAVSHQPSALTKNSRLFLNIGNRVLGQSEEGFGSSETSYSRKPKAESRKPSCRKPIAITVAGLEANATLRSDSIYIQSVTANGQIGDGSYKVQGDASLSIQGTETRQFAMKVSASELEVSDFITALSGQVSPLHGTVSGYAKLNGTGTAMPQISIIGGITELNLHGYNTDFTNRSEIQFQSERGHLTVHLPLELKSSNSRQPISRQPSAVSRIAVSHQSPSAISKDASVTGNLFSLLKAESRKPKAILPKTILPKAILADSFRQFPKAILPMVSDSRKPIAIKTDIRITGTFEAPEITAEWNGNISEMESNGNVAYRDKRITVSSIELKNRAGTSTITGVIPFNLALTAMNISDRFPEQPIDLHLRGYELPLEFFPGIETFFSESDGTVDIDLTVQGTSRNPYIIGDMSLEALRLQPKNFHEPIQNVKVKLTASENRIDFTGLELKMPPGYCTLQQARLTLDGLTPKAFTLSGLRFERFPLGSTVQHAIPPDVLENVEGHVSATLIGLTIPFDRFLTKGAGTPLPHIREIPTLRDIMAVSSADLSINSVRLAFKVRAWNKDYDFQDPRPVPMSLNAGTLTLPEAFILENQHTFPVVQTFTDEDEKPEEVRGDVHKREDAKTTLSIDGGSQWSVNGGFNTALRFKNFDVSAITHTWYAPYRVKGALSGTLQMNGTSKNPKITFRRHESEPAELYLDDIPIDLRWRVRYQNGKWEISKERYAYVNFGGNLLTFSGELPYPIELIPFLTQLQQSPETVWKKFRDTDINGILDGRIEHLSILQSVIPGLKSPTGTSQIHVEFTGTAETPQALGAVRFNNIGFNYPTAGMHVREIEGRIALTEQGATVNNFNGRLNDGVFAITGNVKTPPDGKIWENPPTLDLQASIASMAFEQQGKYGIELDDDPSQFYLQGGFDAPKLTGNINISGGYYKQNWETVRDWLVGASVTEMDLMLGYPILRDLELEVGIDIADNFEVRSSIAGPTDIKISCAGKLVGPIQKPIYNGNVSVLSGKIVIIPFETFEFIEDAGSSITNRSLDVFNPELNLSLRTPKRIRGVLPRDGSTVDLQIQAKFAGTLNNPDFILSTPDATEVLTHEDISAFLVRNISFSHALGPFTFNFHRLNDADARSISAEYQLRENMSIKIESNENSEYGADFEIKGRF